MEEQPPSGMASGDANDLYAKITEQGNIVRKLKGEKAPKVRKRVSFKHWNLDTVLYVSHAI